jgi:hypothetical protein
MYEHDAHDHTHPADDAVLRAVPDLAGVPVEDASGLSVGRLFGALAEANSGLLRYIDLSLERVERHVLVPIGHARFREEDRNGPRVRLRAALLEELEQIPPFPADVANIDDPFERALLEAYGRSFHGERYYAHPSYDHDGIYAGEHPVIPPPDGAAADAAEDAADGQTQAGADGPDTEVAELAEGGPGGAGTGDEGADAEPAAEVGPLRRLAYMPGWRVARGEPDVRGWPLLLADDERLEIRDLIIDPAASRVRYVVLGLGEGQTARLLPVGFLQIRREDELVDAPGLGLEDVLALPEYQGGGVSREQEEHLCTILRGRMTGRRRYLLPDFRPGDRLPGT